MRVVVQRVEEASVVVEGKEVGAIKSGFMILLGVEHDDSEQDLQWLVKKIVGLRVFGDGDGKMNLNITDVGGSILLISQFTLHASTKKGNRPSFIKAARPEHSLPMYNKFISELRKNNIQVASGVFGAYMDVSLVNSGPVTIIIDSKNRE